MRPLAVLSPLPKETDGPVGFVRRGSRGHFALYHHQESSSLQDVAMANPTPKIGLRHDANPSANRILEQALVD